MSQGCREEWLRAHEEEFNNDTAVSLFTVRPYIDFKLAYDFAFSDGHCIDIMEEVALENFLGTFCYDQVRKDFRRNAIVLELPEERLYFGNTGLCKKRMRQKSLEDQKAAASFDNFLTVLEERVFKCGLEMLDQNSKRNLAMILRIIDQGVSAVAMYMFDGFLQVRNGSYDAANFGSKSVNNLMRPNSHDKGSTQIDIIFGNNKVQLSRREHITVQKLDSEILIEPDESKAEDWVLLTLLSQIGSPSTPWKLNFSVFKRTTNQRRVTSPLERSTRKPMEARTLDRRTKHADSFESVATPSKIGLNLFALFQHAQFQAKIPNLSREFECALTNVSSLSKKPVAAVMYKQSRPSCRSNRKLEYLSNEKGRRNSAETPHDARKKPHKSVASFLPQYSSPICSSSDLSSCSLNTSESPRISGEDKNCAGYVPRTARL